jgi:outer membrane protein insertion porin family
MVRSQCRAVLAVCLVLASATAARGQTPDTPLGQTVVAIRFDVEGRPEESPSLLGLSEVRVGEPLRSEDVRSTIARLDALGLYEGVSAVAGFAPGGVEVVFRLDPRHPVTALEIEGSTGISAGTLSRMLQQRYGGVPATARSSAVEATATQMLVDEGYLAARVTSRKLLTHDPDVATLVLDVDAGSLALIRSVEVRGDSPRPANDIISESRTGVGAPYRRREIEAALTVIEEDLRGRGYYEAQLTLQATPSPAGVDIVIGVSTGPRVEVRVRPESALPGSLDELIPIRLLGSVDQDLLDDSRARIENALRAQGYWKASAPYTRDVEQDGALLVVTFSIERGPRYDVARVEVPAGLALPQEQIRTLLGVNGGDLFDEDRFLAGLTRVAEAYRQEGYYAMSAEPTYEEVAGASPARASVVLHPMISEGPAGRVAAITVERFGTPQVAESDVRAVLQSRVGEPYVEQTAARDQQVVRRLYLDRGFPAAAVAIQPTFDGDGRAVTLIVRINEGVRVVIGDISVVGNEQISTRAILEEMRLQSGQPAGTAALEDARRRLVEMGVFRRITISMAERAPGDTRGHLIVNVVESPATTVGVGGGLEGGRYPRQTPTGTEDRIELSPRGFFEISRRNLGGRNRVVSFFSRVGLRPDQGTLDPGEVADGGFGFTEYRVTGTYRERHPLGWTADLLLGVTSEQARRTNFNFARQRASAEVLRAVSPDISVSGRYALEFTRLFDEQIAPIDQPLIDRLFPEVRLSLLASGIAWDRRDSPIDSTRGTLITADLELAAPFIGSEVGYLKGFTQVSAFRALDAGARTVIAGRAMLGVARAFAPTVVVVGPGGRELEAVVEDLPASQRFFAGGSTTVRGFQLDRLGVEEIIDPNGLSLGGNGVIVANVELRRVVTRVLGRDLGVVGFLDGGNVFRRAGDVDLGRLRGTTGFGLRYDSPLGPLRLDFGFKFQTRTYSGNPESGWEYHLSIGEAF